MTITVHEWGADQACKRCCIPKYMAHRPQLCPGKPPSARQAARMRWPLGGADAQALEGALTLTEEERDASVAKATAYERDWHEAKSEFGTAAAKLRERVRVLEAEIEVLRGVGCREAKADEPESGPCGVCLRCAEERGAERWRNAHHEACVRLQAHDCGEEFAILGADAERWRNAHDVMRETVKKLLLSRDASWTGGNDWSEAVDDAIHALGMEPDDDQ